MTRRDDTKLVRECLRGNVKAFEELVDKYQKPVFNIVYRMCHNHEDARDLTQGVFLRAYERLKSFNPDYKFFSWIYRIAINESLNYLDKTKSMNEIPTTYQTQDRSPEEVLEKMELDENIQQALLKIDEKYRALIILKHFQNCSYQQIAQIIDMPEKTVKSRLYIARQQLGKILLQKGIS